MLKILKTCLWVYLGLFLWQQPLFSNFESQSKNNITWCITQNSANFYSISPLFSPASQFVSENLLLKTVATVTLVSSTDIETGEISPAKDYNTTPYELLTPTQAPISSLAESFFGHKFSYLYSEKTILDESLRRCTAFFNASIPSSAVSVNYSSLDNRILSQCNRQATNQALSSRNPAESLRRCTAFFNASIPRLNAIAVNINLT